MAPFFLLRPRFARSNTARSRESKAHPAPRLVLARLARAASRVVLQFSRRCLMTAKTRYKYLGPWRGSHYRQFFYKDRKIRAETLYRATLGASAQTPAEVAEDYDVPVEAVHEAIHYCTHHEELLKQ